MLHTPSITASGSAAPAGAALERRPPQPSQAPCSPGAQHSLAFPQHPHTSSLTLCQNLLQKGLLEEAPSQPRFLPVKERLQHPTNNVTPTWMTSSLAHNHHRCRQTEELQQLPTAHSTRQDEMGKSYLAHRWNTQNPHGKIHLSVLFKAFPQVSQARTAFLFSIPQSHPHNAFFLTVPFSVPSSPHLLSRGHERSEYLWTLSIYRTLCTTTSCWRKS